MNQVLVGSVLSALSTGLGAVPILFLAKSLTHRWRDILLAFSAGIMMAASMESLIPEALKTGGLGALVIGLAAGVLILTLLEMTVPHIDLEHTKHGLQFDEKAMLIIAAITMHNLPEGLSVGVSYASDAATTGNLIALAIGLQNAPEGFLVALFLVHQQISRLKAFLIATLTGAVEIVTSLLGFYLTSLFRGLVPYGLAFAAGAMLFIIYKELIPESHGDGNERTSTYAFIIGIVFMIFLTQSF
ncbi:MULTISPECIES: ZIP family metal transporter [Geobacillus]|jgi:zinc transporter, ZIP family|uniref:GufA protein n=3 Tax=Geobacillus thermodenitrificans TaxID=33940 RepID=A4ILL9_GEOTN|nr:MULTISPECIES: ZIP family metal transporter [Geobacillus]ABO66223.1 GufA protein [Geobacillus thermodenitrificans NG80-2]ARP41953.1 Zinc transporter ZIP11 [Geobacillus thermodenitrificans]ATO36688.1 ZIP family metal transporter [Geobacillus thermodenitrificans]KQB94169.1 dihydroorotate dehydrogenase [Geobacillus sp. PA-3]MEC5188342.1 ZIP family zinc transporter [Geobacillus thermodenitrificans]